MKLNTIYNEECIEGMKRITDGSVDLIVTDPPYLMNYKTGWRKSEHKFSTVIAGDNNPELIISYIDECYRIMKDDSAMYMFCNANKVDFFKRELEKKFKLKNIIVWVKNNHTAGDLAAAFGKKHEFIILVNKGRKKFNGKRISDVWEFDKVAGGKQFHQNQKPTDLIELCIKKHSNEGDVVFDGFMGSGTTAIACLNTNRNYIGFELDKEYYDKSIERIKSHDSEVSA